MAGMVLTLDWVFQKTTHVQVLTCDYVKTVSTLHLQAKFQSAIPFASPDYSQYIAAEGYQTNFI